jgi:hypothetical protein
MNERLTEREEAYYVIVISRVTRNLALFCLPRQWRDHSQPVYRSFVGIGNPGYAFGQSMILTPVHLPQGISSIF